MFPEKRLGLAFMAIWHGANLYLRERGIRISYSRMTRFNTSSRRSHARLGSQRVGQAVFLRLWRAELMLATVRPYLSVSVSAAGRPRLQLPAAPALR